MLHHSSSFKGRGVNIHSVRTVEEFQGLRIKQLQHNSILLMCWRVAHFHGSHCVWSLDLGLQKGQQGLENDVAVALTSAAPGQLEWQQ